MDGSRDAVAGTGVLVAAIRARESARPDRLFDDPFAARLAGTDGMSMLDAAIATAGEQSTAEIIIRTRFFDEELLRATTTARQVVILAAGLDARAYRLAWPAETSVYELDQPQVIAAKDVLLADAEPTARRAPIGVDLTTDWSPGLLAAGFDPHAPSVWLIEGLLQYLDEIAVRALFDRVSALSATGSVALYDVVGKVLLDSPVMAPLLESMAARGAPWLFGTDEPGDLLQRHGWTAAVTDVGELGAAWNRWSAPTAPLSVPGLPRGYLVAATASVDGRQGREGKHRATTSFRS